MMQNKWNTSLPTKTDGYLVTLLLPDGSSEVGIRYFTVEGNDWAEPNSWEHDCGSTLDEKIIAWMELPEVFKN